MIREPVPERGEHPADYHARHIRLGSRTDGRCRICYPERVRPIAHDASAQEQLVQMIADYNNSHPEKLTII